jgi:hypothetical protein
MDWVGALLSDRWIPFRNLHFVNHRLREGLKSHQFKKRAMSFVDYGLTDSFAISSEHAMDIWGDFAKRNWHNVKIERVCCFFAFITH